MMDVREIIARFRTLWEKRDRLLSLLTDRSVSPQHRRRTVWRECRRILFHCPEWLSWQTEPLADMRLRRKKSEKATFSESFHRRVHSLHSITRSTLLGAGVFAFALVISVIAGAVYGDADVPDHIVALSGTLVTVAEVLGGAAGILFAVIVFGIQFHGEKLDKAAFLVRYLRRREGLIPIAAFTLGVVAANVVVSLICSLGLPFAAVPMAILDVALVLFVLWLVLWLIHRMAVSVSEDPATLLMASLTFEYDRALDADIHHAKQMVEFEKALAATGITYSTVAGLTSVDIVPPVKLNLPGRGSVSDINLTALEALDRYIRSVCPNHEATLSVGPSDSVDDTLALVLSARRDDQGRQIQETVAPDVEVVRELQRHLQAVFHLSAATKHDVVEVLDRFQTMLVGYARSASDEELDRWLEVQGMLMERGLVRTDAVPSSFSIHRERLPDFLGGFHPFEMAKNVVASRDQEKVSVLLTFSSRIMATAVGSEQHGLYHRAGEIIEAIYHHAIASETLADYVGGQIDSMLHSLSSLFEYARSSWRSDPQKIASQMPVLMADLAWRLELMKKALEAGRTADATNFQQRLFQWDEHSGVRYAHPHDETRVVPELRDACDWMSYANLIVAAWCLHLYESNHKHADLAKGMFQQSMCNLGSREQLMRLWEAIRSKSFTGRLLDDPFGVIRWTDPTVRRTGVSTAYHVSDAWIERGFMALMLIRQSSPKYEVPDAMRACPPFRPKSPDDVKTLADSTLANDAVRNELLNIADDKRDDIVDTVVALFAVRLRMFKLDRLATVVSTPLHDEHRIRLHAQIAKEMAAEYGLISTLTKLGGLGDKARSWFLPRIRYAVWLQKDSVVGRHDHPMDYAPLIARSIQEGENTRITHAAEQIATATTTIDRLAELADAVRDAIARLRATTRNPILVFVPQERRIMVAIIGQQGWQLPCRRDLGDNHIGDWEGCHLLRFPYFDASSVVIMDALAFYGKIEESASARLDFDIDHPDKDEHDDALRKAQEETDPTKIPETDTVKVLAVARFSSGVGLHDPNAALRVDLDLSQIGFAMVETEGVYHRPDCSLLSAAEGEVVHTLAYRLPSDDGPRTPCEHCEPDDWDEQPEHEMQGATAAE